MVWLLAITKNFRSPSLRTYFCICLLITSTAFSILGCSESKNETIVIKVADDPLAGVRTILEGYVKGVPMRSEVTSFPDFINSAKKANPEKGALLEKGLQELQKPGTNLKAKASELLEKLK